MVSSRGGDGPLTGCADPAVVLIEAGNNSAAAGHNAVAKCEVIASAGDALRGYATASASSTASTHVARPNSVSTVTGVGMIEPKCSSFLREDPEKSDETQQGQRPCRDFVMTRSHRIAPNAGHLWMLHQARS
jgi:hypothetical protein